VFYRKKRDNKLISNPEKCFHSLCIKVSYLVFHVFLINNNLLKKMINMMLNLAPGVSGRRTWSRFWTTHAPSLWASRWRMTETPSLGFHSPYMKGSRCWNRYVFPRWASTAHTWRGQGAETGTCSLAGLPLPIHEGVKVLKQVRVPSLGFHSPYMKGSRCWNR